MSGPGLGGGAMGYWELRQLLRAMRTIAGGCTRRDTAGQSRLSYAAWAISLANGERRVGARGASSSHSPIRRKFSALAVNRCCKLVFASPMYLACRKPQRRIPRERVPSMPARCAYSLAKACVPQRPRATCNALYCSCGRIVSVRRG